MWSMRRPYHWTGPTGDGHRPGRYVVKPGSEEGMAIMNYFLESMPSGTVVEMVERWESQSLIMPYDCHKQSVSGQLGSSREEVEAWLFHGTDDIDAVLRAGFKTV